MEKQTPLFSIIIPTYNRPELLFRAIQSVISQSCKDWECIIIDDGSDDHRVRMAYNKVNDPRVYYHYQERQERSVARNVGIQKAKGEYICFLDDDDEYGPSYIQDFNEYLIEYENPQSILRTGYITQSVDKLGEIVKIKSTKYNAKLHKNPVYFAAYHMVGVWSLCIPSSFLLEDKFPKEFPHWQDTHLILRLLAKHPFEQLSNHNYKYHLHQEMGSKRLFTPEDLLQRTELNVSAIDNLFEKYSDLVSPLLPDGTHDYLRTEKYMRNASIAARSGEKKLAWQLLQKGKTEKRLWRSYVRITKEIVMG